MDINDIEKEANPDLAGIRATEFSFRGKKLNPVTKLVSTAARLMRAFPFGFEMEFANGDSQLSTGNDFLDRSAIKMMWLLSGDATRARRAALNPNKAFEEALDWWIGQDCGPEDFEEAFQVIMQIKADIDGVEAVVEGGSGGDSESLGESLAPTLTTCQS